MSTARALLRHGQKVYRLLRFESSPDGSLIILIDRDRGPKVGAATIRNGIVERDLDREGEITAKGKFTYHTTGQINYYGDSQQCKDIYYQEPLAGLTKPNLVFVYSIPEPSRLHEFDPERHRSDVEAIVDVPEEIDERIGFAIFISPINGLIPVNYGVSLNYEIYSVAVGVVEMPINQEMSNHFVNNYPAIGTFSSRQMDIPTAELAFHRLVLDGRQPIFREEKSGAYVILAEIAMRVHPKLSVQFNRTDLSIEQDRNARLTHKVKFWIKDKGGRNKSEDLRKHISSYQLDAEIY